MKECISIVVVDDSMFVRNSLFVAMQNQEDFYVAGLAKDGIEAIKMIKELHPDIVVLDMVLPGIDGLGVLETLKCSELGSWPSIIVTSCIKDELFIKKAFELGIEYYFTKPYNINELLNKIREVNKNRFVLKSRELPEKQKAGAEIIVSRLIKELGISPHLLGYYFIREAVPIALKEANSSGLTTKAIYSQIATKFCTTDKKVERAIISAIERAWDKGDLFYSFNEKPSNTTFISFLTKKTKSEMEQK